MKMLWFLSFFTSIMNATAQNNTTATFFTSKKSHFGKKDVRKSVIRSRKEGRKI